MKIPKRVISVLCALCFLPPFAWAKQHAFIWDSTNGMQDLGTLGGDNSYALAINDNGQVTGLSYLANNVTVHAFLWTAADGMIDLGVASGSIGNRADAIDASGTIAGQSYYPGSKSTIFSWSAGTFTSLASKSPVDEGAGINDAGYITGVRGLGDAVQAFLWNPGDGLLKYLGTLPGGTNSFGFDVNRRLHVTGASEFSSSSDRHAFFWTKTGGMQDIGSLGQSDASTTEGASINDHDEVVGFSVIDSYAFYWSPSTPITLLPNFQGNRVAKQGGAFQILNDGRIVGNLIRSQGVFHAVIWPNHTSIPQDLGTLPGGTNSYGRGTNVAGQAVGFSDVP